MDEVGVHSNSIVTNFNVAGISPHSGVASKDRSRDGSGKFFTFFSLFSKQKYEIKIRSIKKPYTRLCVYLFNIP